MISYDEYLMSAVVCGDEVTIHVRGKVNTHNCRIWVLQD
jgi:hypothetical protein